MKSRLRVGGIGLLSIVSVVEQLSDSTFRSDCRKLGRIMFPGNIFSGLKISELLVIINYDLLLI